MKINVVQAIGLSLLVGIISILAYQYYQRNQTTKDYALAPQGIAGGTVPRDVWVAEPWQNALVMSDMEVQARLIKRGKVTAILQNASRTTGYQNITVQLRYLNNQGETLKMKEVVLDKIMYPGDAENIAVFQTAPLLATQSRLTVVSADSFQP